MNQNQHNHQMNQNNQNQHQHNSPMTNEKNELVKAVERTTVGLRDAIFDEIDRLRNGTTTPQKASAVCKAANAIVATVKLELDYSRLIAQGNNSSTAQVLNPLQLSG